VPVAGLCGVWDGAVAEDAGTVPELVAAGVVEVVAGVDVDGAGVVEVGVVEVGVGEPPPEFPPVGVVLPDELLLLGAGLLLDELPLVEGLGDGDVVGGGVGGTLTGWHCQTSGELVAMLPASLTVAARLCGAPAALAARAAVTVRNVPPVMRPIAAGRTRAKHM
jgi:hypothetical protein